MSKMYSIRSLYRKFSTSWIHLNPGKTFRLISTGMPFNQNSETEFLDGSPVNREKYINEVKLLGRVGADAQVLTKEGRTYAKFSLATDSYWKTDDIEQQKTEWHTILVFDPNLVNAAGKFIKKGQRLYVSGKLNYITDSSTYKKSAYIFLKNFISFSS